MDAIAMNRSGDAEPFAASEALAVLCEMARRRVGHLPADLIARHVLDIAAGGDWPVAEAAMQALLRRFASAERDELRVASRPTGRRLGTYRTGKRGRRSPGRPYETLLSSVDPPRGSCCCADFLRSSLGLCKHMLVVLDDVYGGKRKLAEARAEQTNSAPPPAIAWHPIRPLSGLGDWLDGVHVSELVAAPARKEPKAVARVRPHFNPTTGRLRHTFADRPERRRELVGQLLSAVRIDRTPALRALLEQERDKLDRVIDSAPLARQVVKLKRKLYPYQRDGVRRFLQSGRLLLADDMGLGKTVQAIAACAALFAAGRVRHGVILVPASLKSQWLREWQQTSDAPVRIVDGSPAERAALYRERRRGFLIMNYEQLLRDVELVQELAPDMVVLDEAQRIKNWSTRTAACVKSLRPRYRLVLTGTPMENRLGELASIFDWVDDLALEPKWRLVPWHSFSHGDGDNGVAGARNLDTLRARIAGSMLRRVRREVIAQLPPRTDARVPVELTPQQFAAHAELETPIAALAARARKRPLTQPEFLRLMSMLTTQRIICNGLAQLEFEQVWSECANQKPTPRRLDMMCSPKLGELRQLVSDIVIEQGRTVVIFSQWRRMLRLAGWAVSDLLSAADLRAVYFTGAESQKQRTRSVIELHDDPATRVMLLSDAGGVGLNLQRAASCCINLELPWNPAVLEQRIGRIYRLGQERPIDVYNLVSEQGIEARIATIVSDKQALFTGLFDGSSNELRFEAGASMRSQLERLIDPAPGPAVLASDADVDRDADPIASTGTSDALIAAADEAVDARNAAANGNNGAGDGRAAVATVTPAMALPIPADVARLVSSLDVRRTDDGGIAIAAPPETAATLAALFGKLSELLASQARP